MYGQLRRELGEVFHELALLTAVKGVGPVVAQALLAEMPELGHLNRRTAAALIASRFHPDLKAAYQGLLQRGKPAKVALVAIMRRLIILLNHAIKPSPNAS
jgi:transposase